jgi:hypothetical protein
VFHQHDAASGADPVRDGSRPLRMVERGACKSLGSRKRAYIDAASITRAKIMEGPRPAAYTGARRITGFPAHAAAGYGYALAKRGRDARAIQEGSAAGRCTPRLPA